MDEHSANGPDLLFLGGGGVASVSVGLREGGVASDLTVKEAWPLCCRFQLRRRGLCFYQFQ